jgi:hypothetical protein
MHTTSEIYAMQPWEIPHVAPVVPLPVTRYEARPDASPFAPPPYSSLFDDMQTHIDLFLRTDRIRQAAEHPLVLKAGQSFPVNGQSGRFGSPATIPEARGGRVVAELV